MIQMSQIGLTESVKGDARRFEIWLQGRAEVHTIQAPSIDVKQSWVRQIKGVLMSQLAELKGKQNSALGKSNHKYVKFEGAQFQKSLNISLFYFASKAVATNNFVGSSKQFIGISTNALRRRQQRYLAHDRRVTIHGRRRCLEFGKQQYGRGRRLW